MEDYSTITIRLLVALFIGAVIGLERSFHGRPAGLRTHSLVCIASSLLMLLSSFEWSLLSDMSAQIIRIDPTRMSQGIMTGIGFLGAGVIMKEKFTVRGLTTAASIWITASIGIIIGMGFYFAATLAGVLTLLVLSACSWLEQKLPTRLYGKLMIRFRPDNAISEEEINNMVKDFKIKPMAISYYLDDGCLKYLMTIRTYDVLNFKQLVSELNKINNITEFSMIPIGE